MDWDVSLYSLVEGGPILWRRSSRSSITRAVPHPIQGGLDGNGDEPQGNGDDWEQELHHPPYKVSMKSLNIPSGGTSNTFDNLFKGKLPDRNALTMVADASATGSYSANPFIFQNFGLNYLVLSANWQLLPRNPLEPTFTTKDYLREYLTVMEAMGYENGIWSGPYDTACSPFLVPESEEIDADLQPVLDCWYLLVVDWILDDVEALFGE